MIQQRAVQFLKIIHQALVQFLKIIHQTTFQFLISQKQLLEITKILLNQTQTLSLIGPGARLEFTSQRSHMLGSLKLSQMKRNQKMSQKHLQDHNGKKL